MDDDFDVDADPQRMEIPGRGHATIHVERICPELSNMGKGQPCRGQEMIEPILAAAPYHPSIPAAPPPANRVALRYEGHLRAQLETGFGGGRRNACKITCDIASSDYSEVMSFDNIRLCQSVENRVTLFTCNRRRWRIKLNRIPHTGRP